MFVVILRFSDNKGQAGHFMDGHKEWIKRGFDDGVFFRFRWRFPVGRGLRKDQPTQAAGFRLLASLRSVGTG